MSNVRAHKKMSRFGRRAVQLVAGALVLAAALWALTRVVGAPAVESYVLSEMKPTESSKRVSSYEALGETREEHYCTARAVAPLVVRLEFGHRCGPLCGLGRTEYFFWVPGVQYRLYVSATWVS
jgi:hypothetical protein